MNSTLAWVNHQSCNGTSKPNPAVAARGPLMFRAKSNNHPHRNPAYSGHDETSARRNESVTKVRSKSKTTTGAETMTSLHAMPAAQAPVASNRHAPRLRGVAASQ